MPEVRSAEVTLADALDIPHWLEGDRALPWRERHARDRGIAETLTDGATSPAARVLTWWHTVDRGDAAAENGRDLVTLLARIDWIVTAAGIVIGAGLAGAVLRYDGTNPVNVLLVLGALVIAPFVFMCLSLLLPMLPASRAARELNIGGLVLSFVQGRSATARAFLSSAHTDRGRARVLQWRLALLSQRFGLAFALAAAAVLLVTVGFSDLAFSWSTTLQLTATDMQRIVAVIAWPWSAWLPQAVPDATLIEQSRYFRLDGSRALSAATLTAWWRFIALALLTWGVLPRAVALLIAARGFRRACRDFLLSHGEVAALLARLDAPLVKAAAATPESAPAASAAPLDDYGGALNPALVVVWNDAPYRGAADNVVPSGAAREFDTAPARAAAAALPSDATICIVTKAWEPPLLELHDLVSALREQAGADTAMVVHPVDVDGQATDAETLAMWRENLARLRDPRVYVQ